MQYHIDIAKELICECCLTTPAASLLPRWSKRLAATTGALNKDYFFQKQQRLHELFFERSLYPRFEVHHL